jgi:hypothetical protein
MQPQDKEHIKMNTTNTPRSPSSHTADAFDAILRPMTLQHHHKNHPFLDYLAKKYLATGNHSTKARQQQYSA